MENLSVADAAKKIRIYLRQNIFRPYFVAADCAAAVEELKKIFNDFEQINVADLCIGDYPIDIDELIEKLKALEKEAICSGLGEYIHFTAQENILRTLQDRTFGHKVIFICRGISNLLETLACEDLKFRTNNVCHVEGRENFSAVKYSPKIGVETEAKNFSEFLRLIQTGTSVSMTTELPLTNVREINNFCAAVKSREPQLAIPDDALTEQQWREYFFDDKCAGYSPEHWRTFVLGFKQGLKTSYLQFVFERSATYEEYRKNLFFGLFEVEDEKIFEDFYRQRKSAVKNISAEYLAEYLEQLESLADGSEVIKYLTDNTAEERRAMIVAAAGKKKIPSVLEKNYSAIKDYLTEYDFGDEELTGYFRRYKKIKLCNTDDEDFKELVQTFALARPYNKFPSRQAILDKVDKNAKLYWLDALGVEFLSFIIYTARVFGLNFEVAIARSNLPTLTAQNRNFYDDWRGAKFEKNQKLDDLIHSPEKFDAEGKCSAPTYLDDELRILDEVIAEIKNYLRSNSGKVILTSDHGASRLAVMYGREIKHRMNSVGEHGGRCCPTNEIEAKPICATEENGYWVMANYDRFAGGRMSSLEVHGGATLEEILVPVIEVELADNRVAKKVPTKKKKSAPLKNSDDGFEFFE